jgi:putative IMPACT (imprinted ancient) family translation regulator
VVEGRADAGEPAGTAGEPILAAIRQADVTETVVVVARYFGGVKLGPGGLARAYGAAAAAALAAAPRRTIRIGVEFTLAFAYSQQGLLGRLLTQHDGHTLSEEFAGRVAWAVWVPHRESAAFARAVTEATAGTVVPQRR